MTGASETRAALLPCPFCGCSVHLTERKQRDELYGLRTWYHIEGKHTGIGGVCPSEVRGRGSAETAIAAWNTRTTAEAESARLIAMVESIRCENAGNFASEGEYWRGYDQACRDIHARITAALRAQAPAVEQTGEK